MYGFVSHDKNFLRYKGRITVLFIWRSETKKLRQQIGFLEKYDKFHELSDFLEINIFS